MFCKNCGAEISDEAYVCPKCGVKTNGNKKVEADDAPSTGFAVLGFFLPLIGFILWLIWKETSPLKAKSCGKGALIGIIVNVVISLIYGIAMGSAIASMF